MPRSVNCVRSLGESHTGAHPAWQGRYGRKDDNLCVATARKLLWAVKTVLWNGTKALVIMIKLGICLELLVSGSTGHYGKQACIVRIAQRRGSA